MTGYEQLQERLAKVEFTKTALMARSSTAQPWNRENVLIADIDGTVTFIAINKALEIALFKCERNKKVKTKFVTKKFKLASGDILKINIGATSKPEVFMKEVEDFISNDKCPVIHDADGFEKLMYKLGNDLRSLCRRKIYKNDFSAEGVKKTSYHDYDVDWNIIASNPSEKDDLVQAIVTSITLHAKKCNTRYVGGASVKRYLDYDCKSKDAEFIIDMKKDIEDDGIEVTFDEAMFIIYIIGSITCYTKYVKSEYRSKCLLPISNDNDGMSYCPELYY